MTEAANKTGILGREYDCYVIAKIITGGQGMNGKTRRPMAAGSENLVSAHKIAFTNFYAVVAQQSVGRGDMEEKLGQAISEQIGLPAEGFFFWCARAQHNFQCFAAINLLRGKSIEQSQCFGDTRL